MRGLRWVMLIAGKTTRDWQRIIRSKCKSIGVSNYAEMEDCVQECWVEVMRRVRGEIGSYRDDHPRAASYILAAICLWCRHMVGQNKGRPYHQRQTHRRLYLTYKHDEGGEVEMKRRPVLEVVASVDTRLPGGGSMGDLLASPGSSHEASDLRHDILLAFRKMPARQRDCLLSFLRTGSSRAAAEELGCSRETVRKNVVKARRWFK